MILYYAITTLHAIVCVILVLVVLLQSGKGADLAGAFGGGATQTAFGSRGPASFLSKMTTIAAVVFMITSVSLSMISTKREASKSILETTTQESAQPSQKKPSAPIAVPSKEQMRRAQEEAEAKHKQQATQPSAPQQQPASKPTK
ncbi:MAG: preprotein translocase subunit SecG [Acidobacteria bacterium]|nr:preprotein translocase subunit SecG [Acidobacteriota bacterium]